MTCSTCNASIPADSKFCERCGVSVGSPKDPFIGRTLLEQFVIQKRLGAGGFGAVYLAEQPKLRRQVAIKTLHTHLSRNPEIVRRFEIEGMAASQIDHPLALKVYASGETEDNYLWLAMEFLEGETLLARLHRERTIYLKELIALLKPVCEVLEAAHEASIKHRDLKPENLMIAQTKQGTVTKILDFGIAGIVGANSGATSGVSGSPPYMAPEQFKGLKFADHRSDIYALGVITYLAATGDYPIRSDDFWGWAFKHNDETPRDPREVAPHKNFPEAFCQALLKALEKKPEDRFQSAMSFWNAINDACAGLPEKASESASARPKEADVLTLPEGGGPLPSTLSLRVLAPVTGEPKPVSTPKPSPSPIPVVVPGPAITPSPELAPTKGAPLAAVALPEVKSIPEAKSVPESPRPIDPEIPPKITTHEPPAKSSWLWLLMLFPPAALLGWWINRQEPTPPPVQAALLPSSSASVPASEPVVAASTQANDDVEIRINTAPPGAKVSAFGKLLCEPTPCNVSASKTKKTTLTIELENYKPGTLFVTKPTPEKTFDVILQPIRFIDNQDETVTDLKNNLIWAKYDNGKGAKLSSEEAKAKPHQISIDWKDAVAYCKGLRAGGFKDWRLPTVEEATSLYKTGNYSSMTDVEWTVKVDEQIVLSGCCTWTSSKKGPKVAMVTFAFGGTFWGAPDKFNSSTRVLCVRNKKK